ncbi:hypothetical protein F4703DRAFT_1757399 [Phycomyces blakesleeanus]
MRYSFQDQNPSWVPILPTNNETWPSARKSLSSVVAPNGKIYLYGGQDYDTEHRLNEFYSFDPATNHFTNLTTASLMYSESHSAVALPNGLLVYTTGYLTPTRSGSIGMPYNRVLVYDTNTDTWETKETSGLTFNERILASATLGPDKKTIFLFGGSNPTTVLDSEEDEATLYNDILMLDTSTWIWKKMETQGYPPTARNSAFMGFISDNILLVAFGQAITTYINDVNVLRLDNQELGQSTWLGSPADFLSNKLLKEKTGTTLSKGALAGIVIGSIAFVAFLAFCIWKSRKSFKYLAYYFRHKILWTPRSGEPIWAEGCRLVFRCVILALFLLFFGFTIQEVVSTDKSIMTIRMGSTTVQTPDIRFCYDGWDTDESTGKNLRPHIICSTDESYDCSAFVTPLNMTVHKPAFSDRLGDVACFLYSPPSWFGLSNSKGKGSNGTTLLFSFYGNPDTEGAIHTTFYPPGKDPNVVKYGVYTTDVVSLVGRTELESWIVSDLEDRYAANTHTIIPNTVSTLSYQIKDHQYITDDRWNSVGFLPIYGHTPEVETTFRSGYQSKLIQSRGNYHISNFKIFPDDFAIIKLQEKKVVTLLNAIGSMGGVISLAVAIQVWIFGFRPNSPWGIIHRWSVGPMKTSVKKGLISQFYSLYTPVPLVSHVNQRVSAVSPAIQNSIDEKITTAPYQIENVKELTQKQRLVQMEERMELMEQLLKSYYVDDEIFRELDRAINQNFVNSPATDLPLEESRRGSTGVRQRFLPKTNP